MKDKNHNTNHFKLLHKLASKKPYISLSPPSPEEDLWEVHTRYVGIIEKHIAYGATAEEAIVNAAKILRVH